MSSLPSELQNLPAEFDACREDFELFRRVMRVARLLQAQEGNNIANGGSLAAPSNAALAADRRLIASPNAEPDDHMDQDDDHEDEVADDSEGDKVVHSPVTAALFNQAAGTGANLSNTSHRRARKRSIRSSTQRSLQQPQAHPETHQQQRKQPEPVRHHAAVEKRYRSVVNNKIQQLSDLIPDSQAFMPSNAGEPRDEPQSREPQKAPTKSAVLDRALQYINHLVLTYEQHEAERNQLRQKLQLWLDEIPSPKTSDTSDTTLNT